MDYYKAPTKVSPLFILNRESAKVEIKGKSTPESSIELYYPIIERIKEIFKGFSGTITIDIALEYINTSSSKCLFDLLKTVKRLEGVAVEVNWYHEEGDEDMVETGEDYEDVLDLKFTYIPVADVETGIYSLMSV